MLKLLTLTVGVLETLIAIVFTVCAASLKLTVTVAVPSANPLTVIA